MDQQIGNELPPLQSPAHNEQLNYPNNLEAKTIQSSVESQAARIMEQQSPVSPVIPSRLPLAQQPPVSQATQATGKSLAGMPSIADDTDLIEKEWVMKAKEIVGRTKHDPYQQNKEVERMKADYLKKRYNKDVKVAED